MDDRILFATDYPHLDFDDPFRILPTSIVGDDRRRKILYENANRLYDFDGSR